MRRLRIPRVARGQLQTRSLSTGASSQPHKRSAPSVVNRESAIPSKPFYVTTPIFYVNAAPHIGHLFSGVLADAIARYNQMIEPGRPVKFVTGTDEHGLKIQRAAEAQKTEPGAFCDNISTRFRDLSKAAGLSNTRFIRTTEPGHHKAVQHLWRDLVSGGFIYKGKHQGWYSVSDEAFYAENQVKEEVVNGASCKVSVESGSVVEWMEEETYKFRLSHFREKLIQWLDDNANAIVPASIRSSVYEQLSAKHPDGSYVHPLEDLSVSRPRSRLSWGITVPDDPTHTIYVWIDALTNYLTAAGYPDHPQWSAEPAWPADVQVIGKDIVRFHAIYWPAMLMAVGLSPPKTLLTHAHWTMSRRKMSKSIGNVVDPFHAIDALGLDAVRYYMLSNAAIISDSDWSNRRVVIQYKSDLMGQIGNLLQRLKSPKILAKVPQSYHYSIAGDCLRVQVENQTYTCPMNAANSTIRKLLWKHDGADTAVALYQARMATFDIGAATRIARDVATNANSFYSEAMPWSSSDPQLVVEAHLYAHQALQLVSMLLQPMIPVAASRLLKGLDVPDEYQTWEYVSKCFGSLHPAESEPSKSFRVQSSSSSFERPFPPIPLVAPPGL